MPNGTFSSDVRYRSPDRVKFIRYYEDNIFLVNVGEHTSNDCADD